MSVSRLAWWALLILLPGTAAQAQLTVQRGLSVRPDTVTVGEPFRVLVRVRATARATITFPEGPDTSAAVEALDPRIIRDFSTANAVEQTAVYRLAAWDVGSQPLRMGDVTVRRGAEVRSIPLGGLAVFVRSVLPADTAERVPKPARGLLVEGWPWWLLWLALLVAAALIGLGIWWWYRRRRRGEGAAVLDPYRHAEREFDRVVAMGLLEAGERGRFVALMVEVVREYLARRFTVAPESLTTSELLGALREIGTVPLERLATLLGEADLIKFARRPVSTERARELGRHARELVRDIEEAEQLAAVPAETEVAA